MRLQNDMSDRFAGMSFICAMLIVFLHGGIRLWGLVEIAVPWFFFAAGYFLAKHLVEDGWWKREVCKRIWSLLIPFWIWGLIGLARAVIVHYGVIWAGYSINMPDVIDTFGWNTVANLAGFNFLGNIGHLWFIRTLFLFTAISPMFVLGSRCVKLIEVVVLFVAYIMEVIFVDRSPVIGNFFEYGFSLRGLAYYVLGLYFRQYRVPCNFARHICMVAGISGFLMMMVASMWIECVVLKIVAVPFLIIFLLEVAGMFNKMKAFSFPIYLMHMEFLIMGSSVLGMFGIRTTEIGTGLRLIRIAFAIAGSIGITLCLRRIVPCVVRILFGGR